MRYHGFCVRACIRTAALAFHAILMLQQSATAAEYPPVPWGKIHSTTNGTGLVTLEVQRWPENGKLSLPTPFAHVTAASYLKSSSPGVLRAGGAGLNTKVPLQWEFNADATALTLELPAKDSASLPAIIELETAERTAQFAGGRITFSALDATVHGTRAKLETHPGNHRIGFWTSAKDVAGWDFKPTRWGRYDLEVTFSADGGAGTELQLELAGQTFRVARPSTGSWYRYQTLKVATFYLPKSEPFTLKAGCRELKGVAVMNLKAVTLRPAPEGPRSAQDAAGLVTLPSSSGMTHSVMMRYEPASNKNCMGYWVNPADWAEWEFELLKPGTFEVEVWQGCGKGQGGSDVAVQIGGREFSFTVEDTGHFQNFIPRRLGRVTLDRAGLHSLAVKPQRKKAGAIMDIRQVRLLPIQP